MTDNFDYALAPLTRAVEDGYAPLTVSEARAIIAEVERLWCRIDDLERAREFVRLKATLHERAAVVAYLRAPGTSCDTEVLADCIENGDHRKEKA